MAQSYSQDEERRFEQLLAAHLPEVLSTSVRRFDRLANELDQQPEVVRRRFEQLEKDIKSISEGRIPVPPYPEILNCDYAMAYACTPRSFSPPPDPASAGKPNNKKKVSAVTQAELDKRKGVPWTEEEHKLFIVGLAKYGKGDWRSISRNIVVTRTPTQVASHAQKYFIRLQGMANRKEKRRASMHEITLPNGLSVPESLQPPPPLLNGTLNAAMPPPPPPTFDAATTLAPQPPPALQFNPLPSSVPSQLATFGRPPPPLIPQSAPSTSGFMLEGAPPLIPPRPASTPADRALLLQTDDMDMDTGEDGQGNGTGTGGANAARLGMDPGGTGSGLAHPPPGGVANGTSGRPNEAGDPFRSGAPPKMLGVEVDTQPLAFAI